MKYRCKYLKPHLLILSVVFISIFLIFFSFSILKSDASSTTFYVDDDFDATTPGWQYDHFDKIQDAINAASNGDIIYIYNGIYREHIFVVKNITIKGESKEKVILDCSGEGHGITIESSGVSISQLTIKNTAQGYYGIKLDGINSCNIRNCNLSGNYGGIFLYSSSNALLSRNTFSFDNYGILFIGSSHNTIRENFFINNSNGVYLGSDTSYNIFSYNSFINNSLDAYDESVLNFWDYSNAGNYWDKYGGEDNDGDGIGDTPYPIDPISLGNFDHYPLMQPYAGYDIFPPDIMNLQANPQIQIPNGSINITCTIIDNVEVNVAYVNITMPNGSYINESLRKINLTDSYYFNKNFSIKGVYSYYVWTNDTSNNSEKSAIKRFVIAYKPTASFIYTPSSNITDLVTITFNASFSSDQDGSIVNYTWDFGDGKRAYDDIVTHKYGDNGDYEVSLTVTDNDGAWDTMVETIHVANVPPVANFSYSPTPPYFVVGQQINFTDLSYDMDGFIYEWKWDFGDGDVYVDHTGTPPTHAYAIDGIFNITLTVKDNDFFSGSMTKSIIVKDVTPPKIKNLTAYPNPQEIHGVVNITCSVIDDVQVNFVRVNITSPDGNFSLAGMNNIKNSSVYYYASNYSIEGNYSYFVWANDTSSNANFSLINNFTIIIPAEPPEIKNVSAMPMQQEYGSPVNISAYVTDNVEVADARVVIENPQGFLLGNFSMVPFSVDEKGNGWYYYSSTYSSLGNYTYFIWAVDINGYTNQSNAKTFRIVDTTPPEITNVSAPQLQEPNKAVNISCRVTDNMNVSKVNITIKFPNGTLSIYRMDAIPPFYWMNATYTFLGKYNYTIQAYDVRGNYGYYNGTFIITFFPIANFTWQPENATDLDNITFNASSSYDDGYILNYTWNFGDGNLSYGMIVSHRYADNGIYDVILTIKDNDGAITSITKQINVSNVPPVANFSYSPLNPTTQDIIQFIDNSSDLDGFIVNYTWNFGDGGISYKPNPSHQYADDGIYNVILTIKDNDGGIVSIMRNVSVENFPPVANFSYSVDGLTVSFTDSSYDLDGFIKNYTWNFGDGNISHEKNVVHSYSSHGLYLVTLSVIDDEDALNTTSKEISIGIFLIPNFSYTPSNPVSGEVIQFIDNSSNAVAWLWNFGDNSSSNNQNPTHIYPIGNYYNVTLTIFNGDVNASISKILEVGTKINIFKNENNVVNYIPWLGNETTASELASLIGSSIMPKGSVVSRWNVTTGAFDSYIVGISPSSYDFVIHPYDGIVLRVANSGSFIEQAFELVDRVVHIFKNENNVVNNVVWTCLSNIKASELASLIGSNIMPKGSVVSRWNVTTGAFDSYIVGISPSSYDFVIHPGDVVVLRVANSGEFIIEVIK